MSSALRVLYVEDDPALRGILTAILGSRKDLEMVVTAGSPAEALASAESTDFDVALLDLSLGEDTRFTEDQRQGWSYILKRADLHPNYLIDVLHSTARGLNVVDPLMVKGQVSGRQPALSQLTTRQRSMLASGVSTSSDSMVPAVRGTS